MRFQTNILTAVVLLLSSIGANAEREVSQVVETPYSEQQVVYDFYFDNPGKMASALYWIRSLMNPLMDDPYNMAPESAHG